MKKSLIALGVLAAASAAAQAQNVTVYGVMDAAVVNGKSGTVTTNGLVSGGHSTSRLGFRGSEDLGGGLKANWGLEAGMAIDTGVLGGPTGATGSQQITTVSGSLATSPSSQKIFNRGAFVGLSGSFGEVRAGSLALAANGFTNAYTPGSGNFDGITMRAGVFATGNQFAVWRDNTVEYTTPNFDGLTVALRHTFGNTPGSTTDAAVTASGSEGTTAANKKFGQGSEIQLNYSKGKLTAGAYDSRVNLTTSATTQMTARGYGATYDFGFMRAGVSMQVYDPSDAVTNDKRELTALGVAIPMSAPLTITANYGDLSVNSAAATKYYGLGAHYAMSKRTTGYAFYQKVDNTAGQTQALSGFAAGNSQLVGTPGAGLDASAIGIGVRHSF